MSVAKMKAAVKAAFANPLSELKKLAIAEASGEQVDQEHLSKTLERAFLPPQCHAANVQRIRRLKERQEARQQLTEATAAFPAAKAKAEAAHAEFKQAARELQKEFNARMAELRAPFELARVEVSRLNEAASGARSTLSVLSQFCHPNPEMQAEAARIGSQVNTIQGQVREAERKISEARTLRQNLLLPGVKLSEAERTQALSQIAEAEAAADEARKQIPKLQQQIAEVNRRSAELRERAFEPANFQLSEPGDSDVKKLMPQREPRKPEYEVMMFS